jgi:2-deoxystreptamine N-acetyl-D-glucosaminyltransferase/2-deoxystreptamine glucosyltransferase
MRIAEVCVRFGAPGGAEAHVAAVSRELAARGHEVVVLTSDLVSEAPWKRGGPFETPPKGVEVVRLRMRPRAWMRPIRMEGLADALRATRADVFHAHSHRYHHLRTTALVARRLGKPWCITPHFHPLEADAPASKRALAWAADRFDARVVYHRAARVFTVTDLERRFLEGLARPGSMVTIPNGIDASAWASGRDPRPFREATGVEGDYVLYAGRLAPNKGLHTLLDAWAHVAPARGAVTLVLAGADGGEAARLRRQTAELGLGDRVRLVGHLDEPTYHAAVAGCRAFVLPSAWEAFGIVLLEAMACGKPVVATAVGGVPEVVRDGTDGLLVPSGDPSALAEALDRVLGEPALAEALGAAGRIRAQAFDWTAIGAHLDAELTAVVAAAGRR